LSALIWRLPDAAPLFVVTQSGVAKQKQLHSRN
jgi:hypothetical protein